MEFISSQCAFKLKNSEGSCKNRLQLVSDMGHLFSVAAEKIDSTELGCIGNIFNVLLQDQDGQSYAVNRNSLQKRLGITDDELDSDNLQQIVNNKIALIQAWQDVFKSSLPETLEPLEIGGFDSPKSLLLMKRIYQYIHRLPSEEKLSAKFEQRISQLERIKFQRKKTDPIDPIVFLDLNNETLTEKEKWRKIKELLKDNSKLKEISRLYPEIEKMKSKHCQEAYFNSLIPALVVKALYRETHYTFLHAQKLSLFVITQLTKELKKLEGAQNLGLFHTLRIPDQEKKISVSDLRGKQINDHEDYYKNKLLSVDGYFFNTNDMESAFSFGNSNDSIGTIGINLERGLIDRLLTHYFGSVNSDLSDRLFDLSMKYYKEATIGNLFTICVRKECLDKTAYTSSSYGIPLFDLEDEQLEALEVLEQVQNDDGENLSEYLQLQYRIVMDQIDPTEGNRVFMHSPVPTAIKDQYKAKIKAIAQEIFRQRQVP